MIDWNDEAQANAYRSSPDYDPHDDPQSEYFRMLQEQANDPLSAVNRHRCKPLTLKAAAVMLHQLSSMRGFPDAGMDAVAKAFKNIVGDVEHAQWLIDRVLEGCDYFPAPIQMRRLFCQRYTAADGLRLWDVDQRGLQP